MISPKLLLSLMVLAGTQSAPQINERQVVGDVLAQLGPAINRAINSIGGSSSFSRGGGSSFSGGSRGVGSSSFSGGNRGSFSSGGSSFSSTPITRFTPSSSFSGGRTSSSPSVSSVTSSVVSSLQPSIAAAVAQALAGSRRGGSSRGGEEEFADGPASYEYSYKVADDEAQAYIAHQENRDGDAVTGSYNYVDPTGSLVTVNYQAGPEGYTQTRDVQPGAVQMRNIPVGWDGPLAGIDDVGSGAVSGRAPRPSGLSQSDLIAQILASIQPQISSAVQGAISANSRPVAVAPRIPVAPRVPVASVRRVSSGSGLGSSQSGLVRNIISSLQPRISSAVNSAISSSRPAPRSRPSFSRGSSQASTGGNIAGLFGNGGNSFRLETPDVAIQY